MPASGSLAHQSTALGNGPALSETKWRDLPVGVPPAPQQLPPLSYTKLSDLPVGQQAFASTPSGSMWDTARQRELAERVRPGAVLAERYEVRREVGRGGMGLVVAAWDRVRQEEIAIKVLQPHVLADPQARERFLNEAKLTSSLSHPGIVRVYDLAEEGALTFLTMELLKGSSLRGTILQRQQSGQTFSIAEVQRIGRELCEALQFAHDQGVVHRDVKPENIWVQDDGSLKIMDFGIARLLSPSQFATTGLAMGTAYYMAPEQMKGHKDVDVRADQYAVGVVLYELLTGDIPQGAIRSPHACRRQVPQRLSQSVMKMLSGRPTDRHIRIIDSLPALSAGRTWPLKAISAVCCGIVLLAGLTISVPSWLPQLQRAFAVQRAGDWYSKSEQSRVRAELAANEWKELTQTSNADPQSIQAMDAVREFTTAQQAFEALHCEAAAQGFDRSAELFESAAKAHAKRVVEIAAAAAKRDRDKADADQAMLSASAAQAQRQAERILSESRRVLEQLTTEIREAEQNVQRLLLRDDQGELAAAQRSLHAWQKLRSIHKSHSRGDKLSESAEVALTLGASRLHLDPGGAAEHFRTSEKASRDAQLWLTMAIEAIRKSTDAGALACARQTQLPLTRNLYASLDERVKQIPERLTNEDPGLLIAHIETIQKLISACDELHQCRVTLEQDRSQLQSARGRLAEYQLEFHEIDQSVAQLADALRNDSLEPGRALIEPLMETVGRLSSRLADDPAYLMFKARKHLAGRRPAEALAVLSRSDQFLRGNAPVVRMHDRLKLALELVSTAEANARSVEDKGNRAKLLAQIALCQERLGLHEDAVRLAAEFAKNLEPLNTTEAANNDATLFPRVAVAQLDGPDACNRLVHGFLTQQSVQIADGNKNRLRYQLGSAFIGVRNFEAAERVAATMTLATTDKDATCYKVWLIDGIAWFCVQDGRFDDAKRLGREGLALLPSITDVSERANMLSLLCETLNFAGDRTPLSTPLQQLSVAYNRDQNSTTAINGLSYTADLQQKYSHFTDEARTWDLAVDKCVNTSDFRTLFNLLRIRARRGQEAEARANLERVFNSIATARSSTDGQGQYANTVYKLAGIQKIALELGDSTMGDRALKLAVEVYKSARNDNSSEAAAAIGSVVLCYAENLNEKGVAWGEQHSTSEFTSRDYYLGEAKRVLKPTGGQFVLADEFSASNHVVTLIRCRGYKTAIKAAAHYSNPDDVLGYIAKRQTERSELKEAEQTAGLIKDRAKGSAALLAVSKAWAGKKSISEARRIADAIPIVSDQKAAWKTIAKTLCKLDLFDEAIAVLSQLEPDASNSVVLEIVYRPGSQAGHIGKLAKFQQRLTPATAAATQVRLIIELLLDLETSVD